MTAQRFKDLVVSFIKELFSASNEVSSKRLLAFYFAIIVTFLMFFNYNSSYVEITMIVICALMGITALEKIFIKK